MSASAAASEPIRMTGKTAGFIGHQDEGHGSPVLWRFLARMEELERRP